MAVIVLLLLLAKVGAKVDRHLSDGGSLLLPGCAITIGHSSHVRHARVTTCHLSSALPTGKHILVGRTTGTLAHVSHLEHRVAGAAIRATIVLRHTLGVDILPCRGMHHLVHAIIGLLRRLIGYAASLLVAELRWLLAVAHSLLLIRVHMLVRACK